MNHIGHPCQFTIIRKLQQKIKQTRLEVLKDGKIINEHDLATKSYYLFGRNKEHSDFLMENPSVSRKHAILQHKDTGQVFLYDLSKIFFLLSLF